MNAILLSLALLSGPMDAAPQDAPAAVMVVAQRQVNPPEAAEPITTTVHESGLVHSWHPDDVDRNGDGKRDGRWLVEYVDRETFAIRAVPVGRAEGGGIHWTGMRGVDHRVLFDGYISENVTIPGPPEPPPPPPPDDPPDDPPPDPFGFMEALPPIFGDDRESAEKYADRTAAIAEKIADGSISDAKSLDIARKAALTGKFPQYEGRLDAAIGPVAEEQLSPFDAAKAETFFRALAAAALTPPK